MTNFPASQFGQMLELCVGNMTDSYKLSHWRIYPKGLTKLYSYLEARAPSSFSAETVFFGLQYFLKRYLVGHVVTLRDLPRLRAFCKHHFYGVEGIFNEEGWKYIIEKHDGRLPVSIKAVPEGTVMNVSNVLMTIENTDPNCAWLTNFLETVLVEVWNTITVASLSRAMKKNQLKYMKLTMDDCLVAVLMPSRVHDFGFRGVSSPETAALSGAAHLVNFCGTDTTAGIEMINQFYCGDEYAQNMEYDNNHLDKSWNADHSYANWDKFYSKYMFGNSIPATEHSQMTIGGPDGETSILENYIKQFPSGFIACVIDSFDTFNFINNISGGNLKALVLGRTGVLVHRPDSGDPEKIVVEVLIALGEKFGFRTNGKGYKVLNDKVRVIQGDGINVVSHEKILKIITDAGWSAENLAFGSGGALLQKVNRDTFAFAFKGCYREINGVGADMFKKPKTDPKKNSKRGRLALVRDAESQELITVPEANASEYPGGDILVEVYRDGVLLVDQSFHDIRMNAELAELLNTVPTC